MGTGGREGGREGGGNNSSAKRRTILDIALMCKSCKNTAGAKRNVGNGENVASKMAALHELQELDRVCVWEMLQDLDRVCVWEMLLPWSQR